MSSPSIELSADDIAKLPQLVAVAMPCFVSNECVFHDMLGGKEKLHKSLRDCVPVLNARFPEADILRPPLRGSKSSCQGVLLRVRRKKGDKTTAAMKAEVVGLVSSSYAFSHRTEYQFISSDTSAKSANAQSPQPFEILATIPKRFPQCDAVSAPAYLFHEQAVPSSSRDRTNEKKWIATAHRIRCGVAVPTAPHPLADMDCISSQEGTLVKEFLSTAFSVRPAWAKKSLLDRCKAYVKQRDCPASVHTITHAIAYLLPLYAFTYTSGPWMGLWVRLGFDPQRQVEGLLVQVLGLKFSRTDHADIVSRLMPYAGVMHSDSRVVINLDSNTVEHTTKTHTQQQADVSMVCFGSQLQRGVQVQICDVQDYRLLHWLAGLGTLTRPVGFAHSTTKTTKRSGDDADDDSGDEDEDDDQCKQLPNSAPSHAVPSRRGWVDGNQMDTVRSLLKTLVLEKVEKFIAEYSAFSATSSSTKATASIAPVTDTDTLLSNIGGDWEGELFGLEWLQKCYHSIQDLPIVEPDEGAAVSRSASGSIKRTSGKGRLRRRGAVRADDDDDGNDSNGSSSSNEYDNDSFSDHGVGETMVHAKRRPAGDRRRSLSNSGQRGGVGSSKRHKINDSVSSVMEGTAIGPAAVMLRRQAMSRDGIPRHDYKGEGKKKFGGRGTSHKGDNDEGDGSVSNQPEEPVHHLRKEALMRVTAFDIFGDNDDEEEDNYGDGGGDDDDDEEGDIEDYTV